MTGYTTNLHPDLLVVLKQLEERMGMELTINSGYRDPVHNKDVGGVEGSEHTYDPAMGADVLCKRSVTRFKMIQAIVELKVQRYGIGDEFIHVGVATDKPQAVAWTYPK